MRARLAGGLALWLGLTGLALAETGGGPQATQAFEEGDCALCHEVPGVPHADRSVSCTGCHTWIREVAADPGKRARAMELFPLWERYERSTRSFLTVPSLTAAMARLEPTWVERYLADPHDLRPGLPESMPRLGLDDDARAAIVAAFTEARAPVASSPEPDPANVGEGARLFASKGCAGCHAYGALHPAAPNPSAPDLAHARERMDPDMGAAWIRDPTAVSKDATMPALGLSVDEAVALRDYVWLAEPGWRPAEPATRPVLPTTEPVTWAEVEERVFGRICVHCHMDPEQNGGRAGPGNAGGFGYAPTGIALQTREQVLAVADRIPDALFRRRAEAARDRVGPGEHPAVLTRPEKPGMPLGLPPLSDEDLSLVLGWLAQGAP